MNKLKVFALLLVLGFFTNCKKTEEGKYQTKQATDANGYVYEYVTNDPMGVRIYTLKNGLKVYLSVNKDEPRLQSFIAVKAGSTYDPTETTGLAHYLEHMMFKGSSQIGTTNWQEEEKLLAQISDLYEEHKNTQDTTKKAEIYKKIDETSNQAAKYALANEYDKMIKLLGAKNTNAYTSNERTVYMNDIPTSEFTRWLTLESERFSKLVLRLFHTELETVYEEFNMSQDNDGRKVYNSIMENLFPNHPYGTQTTLGKAEHLKNPSMKNIHKYWETYYVPNNMAICLSGDLDYEESIKKIDAFFGKFNSSQVPEFISPESPKLDKNIEKEVFGPDAEELEMAFRFGGINSEDRNYVILIDQILSNNTAGLIDLNLNQAQKVLNAGSFNSFMKHYGMHGFYGTPRQGQKLEEVKDLLLEQIEKIKKGDFDTWLLDAAIKDLKFSRIRQMESNFRAHSLVDAFANSVQWADYLKLHDDLEKITKEKLVEFAAKNYNNYVVVYKRQGKDATAVKVNKPKITSPQLNRDEKSEFFKSFEKIASDKVSPIFVDYKKTIAQKELGAGVEFNYMKNEQNELFQLNYIIDMGKDNDKELEIAVNFLPYMGTDKYSPADLKKEFYKHGLKIGVYTGEEQSYVYVSGLATSFDKGVELLEHVIKNAIPDMDAYQKYIDGIMKERQDMKKTKWQILWFGMFNYGTYGEKSSFRDILSEEKLRSIKATELTAKIQEIYSYKHKIFYYGTENQEKVIVTLDSLHKVPAQLKSIPEKSKYTPLKNAENKVYIVDYDMVQANMIMVSTGKPFDINVMPQARLFGEYFGSGLSSIVFQEVREARAMAYSAYASFSIPYKKDENHFVSGYVATQTDKLCDATNLMLSLLDKMPKAEIQFNASRESILKQIETERITKTNIFWTYQNNLQKGIDYDIRENIYNKVKTMSIDEFETFFNNNIKGNKFNIMVLGSKSKLNMKELKKIGKVEEITLDKLFNF